MPADLAPTSVTDKPAPDCIFVYGSLLSTIAHPKGEQLRREASLVGTATLSGSLYRVSWYPALTLAPGRIVHGEVYRMHTPRETLAWLDEYEGITSGPAAVAESDEYERRVVPVTLVSGATLDAWVYIYLRPLDPDRLVETGRWTG